MDIKSQREFEEALRNVLAKLEREGVDRVERSQIEELGQRFDLDPDKARELFVKARGYIWKGEFVESEEEPGWEAVALKNVPSTSKSPEDADA